MTIYNDILKLDSYGPNPNQKCIPIPFAFAHLVVTALIAGIPKMVVQKGESIGHALYR
jgi:hypothetical protein